MASGSCRRPSSCALLFVAAARGARAASTRRASPGPRPRAGRPDHARTSTRLAPEARLLRRHRARQGTEPPAAMPSFVKKVTCAALRERVRPAWALLLGCTLAPGIPGEGMTQQPWALMMVCTRTHRLRSTGAPCTRPCARQCGACIWLGETTSRRERGRERGRERRRDGGRERRRDGETERRRVTEVERKRERALTHARTHTHAHTHTHTRTHAHMHTHTRTRAHTHTHTHTYTHTVGLHVDWPAALPTDELFYITFPPTTPFHPPPPSTSPHPTTTRPRPPSEGPTAN